MISPRNPFRDPVMRKQYDALVRCYNMKHYDLIRPDGARHTGNGAASQFWKGYDGVLSDRWDAASKKLIVWACYRAGRDIACEEARAKASS